MTGILDKAEDVINAAFKQHSILNGSGIDAVPIIAHEAEDCEVCAALIDYFEAIA